ncbi:hypothetical protein BBJ28_00023554 [Nothophytophthora sp. Chile5]|nr:hypothetical protein BBJ28_00023554 [Nothophytophthora sp. Chile5]
MQAVSPRSELTTEHIKSHLQKYRLNYERARLELQKPNIHRARHSSKRRRNYHTSGRNGTSDTVSVFPVRNMKRIKESDTNDYVRPRSDLVSISQNNKEVTAQRPRSPAYDQELIAAAIAVDACRYPVSQTPELADPQWNVFMGPRFTQMPNSGREGALPIQSLQATAAPTIDEMLNRRRSNGEAALLYEESSERQMQLAMLTQMNFHRQMLTRKVEETARDLSQNYRPDSIGVSGCASDLMYPNSDVDTDCVPSWANPWQFQQQQQRQRQRQRQQHMNEFLRPSLLPPMSPAPREVAFIAPLSTNDTFPPVAVIPAPGSMMENENDGEILEHNGLERLSLTVDLDDEDLFDFLKA